MNYAWKEFFTKWFEVDSDWKHFYHLKRRFFNYLNFVEYFYPRITESSSVSTTLKFPHTSQLRKIKHNLSSFFQKMINEINSDIILFSNPELHKCHLKCHYLEFLNQKGEKFEKHSAKFCKCVVDLHAYCKRAWHLMNRHNLDINFQDWPYGKFSEIINPLEKFHVKSLNREIDHLTLKLCYEMKTWISFYDPLSIKEFQRHGFNLQRQKGYFVNSFYSSEKHKKSRKNSSYYSANKEKILLNKSSRKEVISLNQKIRRMEKKISISRDKKKSFLRDKLRELKSLLLLKKS